MLNHEENDSGNFPTLMNITGIRFWFEPVKQASYTFSQVEFMASLWELVGLLKIRKFYWDETLDQLFYESKQVIVWKIEDGV